MHVSVKEPVEQYRQKPGAHGRTDIVFGVDVHRLRGLDVIGVEAFDPLHRQDPSRRPLRVSPRRDHVID